MSDRHSAGSPPDRLSSSRIVRTAALRLVGLVLLVAMLHLACHLAAVGPGFAGHEPAAVYGDALLAFLTGSVGLGLLIGGQGLFEPVTRRRGDRGRS